MKKLLLPFVLFPAVIFSQNLLQTTISSQNNDIEIRQNNTVDITSSDLELSGIDGSTLQETYLRFEGISLPSDAIINNVYLVFYGDETSNNSTSIKIFGEIGNSSSYPTSTAAATGLNVKSRNYSTNFAQWNTSGCVINQEYQSPDLKNVVTEMFPNGMNNSNIAFKLQGNGQGAFTVRSFSAAVAQRPKLVIDYWSNFGSNSIIVSSNYDDGRENNNGGMVLGTAYLYLGGSSTSKNNGIRFQNVNIPADAEITNAYIEFYSYSTSPAGNVEIQTELNNSNIFKYCLPGK